jgi:hypothetical protein
MFSINRSSASDNCTTVTVTRSPASLVKGSNTVTWTATDGNNNTATSTQTVTVVNNQFNISCPQLQQQIPIEIMQEIAQQQFLWNSYCN